MVAIEAEGVEAAVKLEPASEEGWGTAMAAERSQLTGLKKRIVSVARERGLIVMHQRGCSPDSGRFAGSLVSYHLGKKLLHGAF